MLITRIKAQSIYFVVALSPLFFRGPERLLPAVWCSNMGAMDHIPPRHLCWPSKLMTIARQMYASVPRDYKAVEPPARACREQ